MSVKLDNKAHCRTCLKQVDGATAVNGPENTMPSPGDFSICLYCGTLSKFDKDLNLEPLTDGDLDELKRVNYEAVIQLQKMGAFIKERNQQN